MGLRNWLRDKHLSDPVQGALQVTGASSAPMDSVYGVCRLHGVITAPGLAPTPIEHRLTAPVKKWPYPGSQLPVTVDRADPTRLQVDWDAVPTGGALAAAQAEQLAQQMRATATPPRTVPPDATGPGSPPADSVTTTRPDGTRITVTTSGFDLASLPPDVAAQVEGAMRQAFDMAGDLTGPVVIGAPGRPAPGAPGGGLTPEQSAQLLTTGGGEEAAAVVVAAHEIVRPAGLPTAPGGLVDITLDITRRDGSGYTAVTRIGFRTPERRAQVATVGTRLTVRIDPADPSRVVIDTSKLP